MKRHLSTISNPNIYSEIIGTDFNGKITQKIPTKSDNIKNVGFDYIKSKNENGDMVIFLLNEENIYCLNTFFRKFKLIRRSWAS